MLLSALPAAAGQLSVAWNDNSTNETSFKIERAGADLAFTQIATVGSDTTVYTDTSVSPSTTYWYRVRASNASGDSGYTNVLMVTAPAEVGTAPSISNIADTTISTGSSTGALAFTISDAETAVGNLLVTGASSNTALVPNSAIVFGGSGSNRTVTVTPTAAQTGTAMITMTVSDGSLTANTTFLLTVGSAASGGLVAAYSFNEGSGAKVADASGNGNTGTISGASWTTSGKHGGALSFNGSNNLVTIASSASLNLSSAMTLEAWVYPTADQSGWRTIFQRNDAYYLHAGNDAGDLRPAGGGILNGNAINTASPSAISANTWTHLALTYDGVAVRLYVNGNQVASTVTSGGIQTNSNAFSIGGNVPYGEFFQGRIDEARVYNRALSQAEIQTDMNTAIGASNPDGAGPAPSISDIADQSIAGNTSTAPLPFTVSDADTAASSLIVTGSSSNVSLVPNSAIVFGGSGANRTVTVTPATGQTGTATITVTVSDGVLTASDTFVVNVRATNTAPTISSFASQLIVSGSNTGPIAFSVGDAETTAGSLTVLGGSANTALVPVANIVFGGSGANRTVTVTPAPGQIGTTTITVAVSDGALASSTSFPITVLAAQSAPSISNIADTTISTGSSTGALAFTISDAQTAAASLLVTGASSNTALVPNSAIVFGGSGSNRTVTVTPVTDQTGTATITVTVSDGGSTASDTFVVTVNPLSGTTPQTQSFSNTNPIEIPDASSEANPYPSQISVGGTSGAISQVTVQLNGFGQIWTNDMDVLLVSPTGQKLMLMSDVGTGVTNNATFTFSDTADAFLPESGNLQTGTYKPTNYAATPDTFAAPAPAGPYASSFSTFQGQNANGTWTLYVKDDGPGKGRRFEGGWTLTLTTSTTSGNTTGGSSAAPAISDIADQSIVGNTSTAPLPFTVSDADTAASNLILSGSSSNVSLVPNSGIMFSGSGANRTVTVTPATGQTGTAMITVTVSDGALTASDTFAVTVNAVSGIATQTQSFSNLNPIVIPDAGSEANPYPSQITVTGFNGLISTVTVQLSGFSQIWSNDIDVLLVSPTGQKVLLMSDVGTGVTKNATFTFSDSASEFLPESLGLHSGTYKPTNYDTTPDTFAVPAPAGPYAGSLSTFQGQNPNGTWSLFFRDEGTGLYRRIEGGWSLTITTSGVAP